MINRRGFLWGSAAAGISVHVKAAEPVWRARQFHNQPAQSHQHQFLVGLWNAVKDETGGRIEVTVHPQNNNIPGSDPGALDMLRKGELEFFTLMGGILGHAVPAMEIQGLPFAFSSHEQVHKANDGPLGAYLAEECAAKGIHRFHRGLMENGFRHFCMIEKPIRTSDDLVGLKLRIPDGQMFRDLFTTLEADATVINIRDLREALTARRVDGHENPLVITEVNKLYELTRAISLSSHMWSGFNILANLEFWKRLPSDIQAVIDRNVTRFAAEQRVYTNNLNLSLQAKLAERGMTFHTTDTVNFRTKLATGFYPRWKAQVGEKAWALLEQEVGRLG